MTRAEERVLACITALSVTTEQKIVWCTGLTIETVTRAVNELLRLGLIKVNSPDIEGSEFRVEVN